MRYLRMARDVYRWLRFVLSLGALLTLVGCGGANSQRFDFVIDPAFAVDEQEAIAGAAQKWRAAVADERYDVDSKVAAGCVGGDHWEGSTCTTTICVHPAGAELVQSGDGWGFTDLYEVQIFTFEGGAMPDDMRLGLVSHVAQHELGHAQDLGHLQAGNVMDRVLDIAATQTRAAQDVAPGDVAEWRRVWRR